MPTKRPQLRLPTPDMIHQGLRKAAPDVAFSLEWAHADRPPIPLVMPAKELERMFEQGYREHVVRATAAAVVDGRTYRGSRTMTGFFYKPGEVDPGLDGWLPEMLLSAARELSARAPEPFRQGDAAAAYLEDVRRAWGRPG